jgi:predicted AlkP superfamily pyrophosphatase or phosphodiesterase
MRKVILISIDGMRPDGVTACNNPFVAELTKKASYTFTARTVFPSVTLPCHMSMFHSVPPTRHGMMGNQYITPVHPITGIFEHVCAHGGTTAMFYGWEHLRDISRPGSLTFAEYIHSYSDEFTDGILTDKALSCIDKYSPDFVFLYMVETDEKGGHDNGWMSQTYLDYISKAMDNVKRVIEKLGDEYTVIVTADHGGHERIHGTDMAEDMTIPMFFFGKDFIAGKQLTDVSILDIAPTVADVMELPTQRGWEGTSVLKK